MKFTLNHAIRRRVGGYTLLDCLVYISLIGLFMTLALTSVYGLWRSTDRIKQNAQSIALVMQAGERWRDDVRRSTRSPELEKLDDGVVLKTFPGTNEVLYAFDGAAIWRRPSNDSSWSLLLKDVKASEMKKSTRDMVAVWEWNLELQSRGTRTKMKPLFSFLTVEPKSKL